jgi:hypothetical protein
MTASDAQETADRGSKTTTAVPPGRRAAERVDVALILEGLERILDAA